MRSLPAILIAALAALVILASAVLTTQFGMHDWPTPPMPDTATRLVTPDEPADGERDKAATGESGGVEVGPTADARAAERSGRGARGDERRRGRPGERQGQRRHGASRRDERGSGRRDGGRRRGDGRAPGAPTPPAAGNDAGPADPAPAAPAPTPVTGGDPTVIAGPGDGAQARSQEPAPAPSAPAGGDDDPGSQPDPGGDDDSPGEPPKPGKGRGPIGNVLEVLLGP